MRMNRNNKTEHDNEYSEAYVSSNDPMFDGRYPNNKHGIVRLMPMSKFPGFMLLEHGHEKVLDPHEVLRLLGSGRLSFTDDHDKEEFISKLDAYLPKWEKLKSIMKTGAIISFSLVSASLLTMMIVMITKHADHGN